MADESDSDDEPLSIPRGTSRVQSDLEGKDLKTKNS